MNKEKIYMDKKGYEEYLDRLEDLKVQLSKVRKEKGRSIVEAVGDGWHDNFAFEDSKRQEMLLIQTIIDKTVELENIIIIEKTGTNQSIDIGTAFLLQLSSEEYIDEAQYKLVGNIPDLERNEISLNSPLGKAVYLQKEGDKIGYKVGDIQYSGKIIKVIG